MLLIVFIILKNVEHVHHIDKSIKGNGKVLYPKVALSMFLNPARSAAGAVSETVCPILNN